MNAFFAPLILSLLAFFIAKRLGYFRFLYPYIHRPFSFTYLLGVFLVYLGTTFFLIPLLYALISYLKFGSVKAFKLFPPDIAGYLQFFSVLLMGLLIIGYCMLIKRDVRQIIFWGVVQTKKGHTFL